jgi:hypothetical protein
MSNDPPPGGEQPGWQGHQPYPGSYGQHGEQPGYPGAYAPHGYGQQQPPPWAAPTQQQRPGYPPAPQGGPAGIGPGGAPAGQTFFGALFDFGFNEFATFYVIRAFYIIGLALIGIGYVVAVISGFFIGAGTGLVAVVLGALVALFFVIFFRVALEFRYALVRMAEDIRAMRGRG